MFCNNCGKNLPDGAKFCDGCGTQLGVAAPAPARAAAPAQSNPMVDNFLKVLKGFFSKDPLRTVEAAAKSSTLEFILVGLLSILAYSLAIAANVGQLIAQLVGAEALSYLYNFGIWFLFGLLFSVVAFALLGCALFIGIKIVTNGYVDIKSVFNVVAVGTLPLACVYLANILLGFIWWPIPAVVSIAGIFASVVYMYTGVKKLAGFSKEPFVTYSAAWSIAATIVIIIAALVINAQLDSLVSSVTKSAMFW